MTIYRVARQLSVADEDSGPHPDRTVFSQSVVPYLELRDANARRARQREEQGVERHHAEVAACAWGSQKLGQSCSGSLNATKDERTAGRVILV